MSSAIAGLAWAFRLFQDQSDGDAELQVRGVQKVGVGASVKPLRWLLPCSRSALTR